MPHVGHVFPNECAESVLCFAVPERTSASFVVKRKPGSDGLVLAGIGEHGAGLGDYHDATADFGEKGNDAECKGGRKIPEENTADDKDDGRCGHQDEVSGDGEGCRTVNGLASEPDLKGRIWDFVVLHVWDDELV